MSSPAPPSSSSPTLSSPSPTPEAPTTAPSTFTSTLLFPLTSLSFLLSLLHEPSLLASLDPTLLTSLPSPSDPLTYLVTDTQSLLFGLFRATVTYKALFELQEDGTEVTSAGPYGLTTRMRWRVKELETGGEGGCEVSLEAESTPAWWTMGMVTMTVQEESKRELMDKFRKRVLEEEQKKRGEQV